jgi:hypothetical protein
LHKRIPTKFSQVQADHIKAEAGTWQLRLKCVEAKRDFHREKWRAVIPNPERVGNGTPPESVT